VDAEGAEKAVLEGTDFSVIRPWIVVVESTIPLSQDEYFAKWDSLLTTAHYEYVYFDGLNRFYVACEHNELKEHFKCPPNIFDDFVLSGTASQPFYKLIEEKTKQAEEKVQRAEMRALQAEQQAENIVREIYTSRSWRITAPLRAAGKVVRWFALGFVAWITFAPMSRPRRVMRKTVTQVKLFLSAHLFLQKLGSRILAPFPRLRMRLKMVGHDLQPVEHNFIIAGPEQLPPRARQIYNDLLAAIGPRGKERF